MPVSVFGCEQIICCKSAALPTAIGNDFICEPLPWAKVTCDSFTSQSLQRQREKVIVGRLEIVVFVVYVRACGISHQTEWGCCTEK